MKKTLCLIYILTLILMLCACGSKSNNDASSNNTSSVSDSVTNTSDSDSASDDASTDASQNDNNSEKGKKKSKNAELSMETLMEYPVTPADQFEYYWVTVKNPDGTFTEGKEIAKYLGKDDIVVLPEEIDGVPIIRLGWDVFGEKSSVKAVKISDSILEIQGSFEFNQNLKYVAFGKNVHNINSQTFFDCDNIEELTLNEGVHIIEMNAFANMNLKSIYVPDSVQEIDPIAFYGSLTEGGIIYGKAGSVIESYCQENNYTFEVVE